MPARDPAAEALCTALGTRLPVTVGAGLAARGTTPSEPGLAAWGEPPVVLRCGVPPTRGATAGEVVVDGVRWDARPRGTTTVFLTVGRPVLVEVTVPEQHEGGPVLGDLAPAVLGALPSASPTS